jgi:spore coat polysaccharide biosynthesis protein SpsF
MSREHTVAIVQGRMNSSRLPGKILLDLAGRPMLEHVLERARSARLLDQVVMATTTDPSDDPVEDFCQVKGYPVFRGDMFDVLDRFYQAARQFKARIVVRITADCPVIDPALIDMTVRVLQSSGIDRKATLDFSCNRLPPPWRRTFPIGLDVEVCTFAALEHAWQKADQKFHREHVMPYIYEGVVFSETYIPLNTRDHSIQTSISPRGFRIAQLHHNPDYGAMRWTVDTPEDLEVMRNVLARFDRDDFSWQDVLALQRNEPELFAINAAVEHRTAFDVDERQKKD